MLDHARIMLELRSRLATSPGDCTDRGCQARSCHLRTSVSSASDRPLPGRASQHSMGSTWSVLIVIGRRSSQSPTDTTR